MPATRAEALDLLRRALGDPAVPFRAGQWEAIDAIVNRRRRVLVVERTGWGKSSVYFIATRLLRDQGSGPTLIISPLLALMRNQVEAAGRLELNALTINSANQEEWPAIRASVSTGRTDALLISPERLANDAFIADVLMPVAARIGLVVVDEAHCISDWGHDFRPDYQRLVDVLRAMPRNMPVLGTTATANDRVITDVCAQLGDVEVQRGALMRETLLLQTLRLPDQAARMAWLAEHVPALPGTGIIYALTKRDAEQVAAWLRQNGTDARAYYSDVKDLGFRDSHEYRLELEDRLYRNRIKALVATSALGMGYDKPDLGFVVHYQAPGSIISYYQQVGRAGRAIELAYGILLSGREDEVIHEYFRSHAFPTEEAVQQVLQALEGGDGLDAKELEQAVNLPAGQLAKALRLLATGHPAAIFREGKKWMRTATPYQFDHEKIARLSAQREVEWRQVQEYIDCSTCLMMFLGRKLDDPQSRPCGKCARCVGSPLVPEKLSDSLVTAAARYLRTAEFELICKKQIPKDGFPQDGFERSIPASLQAEQGRILSRWGDSGWGKLVAEGKHAGRFSDDLVRATAEMLTRRWRPQPSPTWVTCVPSLVHPTLVHDFAARLARDLGLPFVSAVTKVRQNLPQKVQENRFHQCRNLDGVFAVDQHLRGTPVLLVDDVVDSGWTLTIVAALLRRAGSGRVHPFALASSAAGE